MIFKNGAYPVKARHCVWPARGKIGRENTGMQPFTERIRATAITGRNVQTAIVRSANEEMHPARKRIDTPDPLRHTQHEIISEMDFVFGSTPVSKNTSQFWCVYLLPFCPTI